LERCTQEDRFHDYVLSEYAPRAPHAGKLRSVSFLHASFEAAGVEGEGREIVELVREGLGSFRTVWGVKLADGAAAPAGWELYFYDFERAHADLSIERVRAILAPRLDVDARDARVLPWHMFSIGFDVEGLRAPRPASVPAHVYLDMRSYELQGDELSFENIYTFHDPRAEIDEVLHRLRASAHFGSGPSRPAGLSPLARHARSESLATLVPPHLFRCGGRVCVANKRTCDALYFSRVGSRALARFLRDRSWPAALRELADVHAAELDHLLWDVGIDFRASDAGVRVVRSAVYGSF
jgi:hypothetical protein